MADNGTRPVLTVADPWVNVTQHGVALNVESNLQGPHRWAVIRQMLVQAADAALLEYVKGELQGGGGQIVLPTLAVR